MSSLRSAPILLLPLKPLLTRIDAIVINTACRLLSHICPFDFRGSSWIPSCEIICLFPFFYHEHSLLIYQHGQPPLALLHPSGLFHEFLSYDAESAYTFHYILDKEVFMLPSVHCN